MAKTEVITTKTSPDVKKALEKESKKAERKLSWWVDKILTEYATKKKLI